MEKKVVELFAGVGGFRCGLNKVTLKNDKVKENGNWKFVSRLNILNLGIGTPLNSHLLGFIDEIDLAMKGRFPAGGKV